MNTYEAIFVRKSVRSYRMDPVAPEILEGLKAYYAGIRSIFAGIETQISIIENLEHPRRFGMWGIKAPYYLAIYSEEKDRYGMNAGYIMEQISLYLLGQGIGSCFFGGAVVPRALREMGGKKLVILMAFGMPKGTCTRKSGEAKRLELHQICAYKEQPRQWVYQLLEAARMAPSSFNSQPWRFLVRDDRIHVFAAGSGSSRTGKFLDFNFGVMFSHLMTAADEFWMDVDLIRLEDISQKNFKNSDYILSVIPSRNKLARERRNQAPSC
ncbi:MAG: nitroreductase family protein [Blautia sp.]|jgi:nitroreductase